MPGPQVIIEHMMNGAVPAYHVMRTHLRAGKREGPQCSVTGRLSGVMNDHKIGLAHPEICSAHPFSGHSCAVDIGWFFGQLFCKCFCLFFVTAIGGGIFTGGSATCTYRKE